MSFEAWDEAWRKEDMRLARRNKWLGVIGLVLVGLWLGVVMYIMLGAL